MFITMGCLPYMLIAMGCLPYMLISMGCLPYMLITMGCLPYMLITMGCLPYMLITMGCLPYMFSSRSLNHGIMQLDAGSKLFRRLGNSVNQKTAITVTMHQTFFCRILEVSSKSRRFVARLRGTLLAEATGDG